MSRTKIASQEIDGSILTLSHYGEPDETGKQSVKGTLTYDLDALNTPDGNATLLSLACVGLGRLIEGRYNRANIENPDVPAIANATWDSVCKGEWKPGSRDSSASEPTDLELALAEVTGQPVHIIQQHFEEDMQKTAGGALIRNAKGQTMRLFNKAYQVKLAADPEVAVVLARIEREKAQRRIADAKRNGASAGLVKGLFGSPSPQAAAAQ